MKQTLFPKLTSDSEEELINQAAQRAQSSLWSLSVELGRSVDDLVQDLASIEETDLGSYKRETESVVEEWLATPEGAKIEAMSDMNSRSNEIQGDFLSSVRERSYEGPNRVHAALCSTIVAGASDRVDNIGLMRSLAAQLDYYVYEVKPDRDQDQLNPRSKSSTFAKCLRQVSHFEKLSILTQTVHKLEADRLTLEAEEAQIQEHRTNRGRVIRRTIKIQSDSYLAICFSQWAKGAKQMVTQRQAMINKIVRLREYSLHTLFRAWRATAVQLSLTEKERRKLEADVEINELRHQLKEAQQEEKRLEESVKSLQSQESKMSIQLLETKLAIDAQKVPETMRIIHEISNTVQAMGSTFVSLISPLLDQIEKSPSYQKIALMFYSVRDEELSAKADAAREVANADKRSKYDAIEASHQEMMQKRLAAKQVQLEKAKIKFGEEARSVAEARYKDSCEIGELSFKKEDMEAVGVKAMAARIKELEDEHDGWLKEQNTHEENRLRDLKAEQAEEAKQNEIEFNLAVQVEERTRELSEKQVQEAFHGLHTLPPDHLILRWLKYHLRRTCWKGYQYTRKCENYRDDLRDGTTYLVLFKRVLSHVYPGDQDLENEIDPNVRLATVMKCAELIEPPATGFTTTGHILGADSFLNAAFLIRIMMTSHGLNLERGENSEVFLARQRYQQIKARWEKVSNAIHAFGDWSSWKDLRAQHDDKALEDVWKNIATCAEDLSTLYLQIQPLAAAAERGRREWGEICSKLMNLQWSMFACKVRQEEEVPPGLEIDPGEHAPIRLVDFKFEKKFKRFTEIPRQRIRMILDQTVFIDARKERHWIKIREAEERAKEEKRKVKLEELELTEQEVEGIRQAVVPLDHATFDTVAEAIEKCLRERFDDVSRIFKFYAAGGNAGQSDGLSLAEWWSVANDCRFAISKDERTRLEKGELEELFDATETEEEIETRNAAKAKAEFLGQQIQVELEDYFDDAIDESLRLNPQLEAQGLNPSQEDGEEELAWDLAEDEREIGPEGWVELLLRLAMRKFGGDAEGLFVPYVERLRAIIDDFLVPNAGKSNTDTFRGELSLDEVQNVMKSYKKQLMQIFRFYAKDHVAVPGQPIREPSLDGPRYIKMLKDSKIVTRQGDLRHDFPEAVARKVFDDVQSEEEGRNSVDAGGGDDEMVYMEYIEAWGAIANFKVPNPYIPLHTKLEDMLTKIVFVNQNEYSLKGKVGKLRGQKSKR